MRPRVWIDDPHPIYRRGLAATLSGDYWLSGESVELRPLPPDSVDVIVFHLTLPALRKLESAGRTAKIVGLISQQDAHLHARALAAGVAGLVLRDRLSTDHLKLVVGATLAGQTVVPTELVSKALGSAAESMIDMDRITLLNRELEVLRHLADGGDTRGIAERMNYSERTVKNVVHDVLIKMNCRNRAHAVAVAARHGII